MKGRAPTAEQKRFHDLLCREIGCIACMKDGYFNSYCLPHHIDGRTKPAAHWLVLPLCAGHHQEGTGIPGLIPVHPWKPRFEAKYGRQTALLGECIDLLLEGGYAVPSAALQAAQKQNPDTAATVPGLSTAHA